MKKFFKSFRRIISFLVIFSVIFSLFPDMTIVNGAVEDFDMRYERVKQAGSVTYTDTLYIYGTGFTMPLVKAGSNGSIPIQINTTRSNSNMIVIDDQDELNILKGIVNKIKIFNNGTVEITPLGTGLQFDLTSIPTVTSISKNKAYVGTPLIIDGNQFDGLNETKDKLFISGTQYSLKVGTDADDYTADIDVLTNSMSVGKVKSPVDYGLSDIKIVRKVNVGADPDYEIHSILTDSITVVSQISNIEIERIDPNAGPKNLQNIISIYGKPGKSNFKSDMRIFAGTSDQENKPEGTNKGTIQDQLGNVIGIKFQLPTRAFAGTVDLVITTNDLSSEFVIPNSFVYMDIGNTLTLDEDGINPNNKKETEYKEVEIKGRNIGFFNGVGYENLTGVAKAPGLQFHIGTGDYDVYTEFDNSLYYKLKYTGTYDGNRPVTIIRQFRVIIDGDATVMDAVYQDYTLSKDTIWVIPQNVNLNPNEPKSVDVSVQTKTTVIDEALGFNDSRDFIYNRTEEYVLPNGFTFYPDELSPYISSVTPSFGPVDKEIYMTVYGKDFEVSSNGTPPTVRVGGRLCTNVKVYDIGNKLVDGIAIKSGTKIKCILPAGAGADGVVDVIVRNPSSAQKTLVNGFEFRTPDAPRNVAITELKNAYADVRGGIVSGETVLITGDNFDTSSNDTPRIVITIDGEQATIQGKVSSDGKTVTVIPPPGTVAGMTKLQLINEDGSMASANFEYKLITSDPKIASIVPIKGGKGTKLIIKGEDFILPDSNVTFDNPKRKGSVVLLNGVELNAYKYLDTGTITNIDPVTGLPAPQPDSDIYYRGTVGTDTVDGQMVQVQDTTTIYVDLPDKYYSFQSGSAPYLKATSIPLGNLKVEVLNPDGAKSKQNVTFQFLKPATSPTINANGVNPNKGSTQGGTVVTIRGSGYVMNNIEVYFGSEKSENVQFISASEVRAVVPEYPYPLPAGTDQLAVPVMVLNYDGGAAVLNNGFTYRVPESNPVISAVKNQARGNSATGSAAGGEPVLIEGTDFRRDPNDPNPSGLPKVYFNGVEATGVTWLGGGSNISQAIRVTTPASQATGPVDVTIVNYDSGTFTLANGFTYIQVVPSISKITPDVISMKGNVKIQVTGSNFTPSNLGSLFTLPGNQKEKVGRHTASPTDADAVIQNLAIFGDAATGDVATSDLINLPSYKVMRELRFDFVRVDDDTIQVTISKTSDGLHAPLIRPQSVPAQLNIDVDTAHMFIINGEEDLGTAGIADEGILVEISPYEAKITRRIAPYVMQLVPDELSITAPPTADIGQRNMYIRNNDGGEAAGTVTIKNPTSNPTITQILPRNMVKKAGEPEPVPYTQESADDQIYYTFTPLDGGAFVTIVGSDFRPNVKAYMGDRLLEIVSINVGATQMVVKVPQGNPEDDEKDFRILVVNEDGASADSSTIAKPHYIRYQSAKSEPKINSINPEKSSRRGNNSIEILGEGFVTGTKVYIAGMESATVTFHDDRRISASVPAGLPVGDVDVQVMNPDYGFFELKAGLTIISSPQIDSVIDEKGRAMDPALLSIEGGEKIKLQGLDFFEGAQVIIGGTLKPKSELAEGETGTECMNINNITMVIIGGTQATNVKVESETVLSFTTPKLTVGNTSIIVFNTDTGVSNVIDGQYQKPIPDAPAGLQIEIVDADTIKVEWDKIEDTEYYEIYVSISTDGKKLNNYQYLGSVIPSEISETRLRYFMDGLLPATWYSVKLKSVNLYGASKFSSATPYKKTTEEKVITYLQIDDQVINGINQNDKVVVSNMEVTYMIGEKSISDKKSGAYVNFDQPGYSASKVKTVKINFLLIKKHPGNKIKLSDKNLELNFTANSLAVDEAVMVSASLHADTEMRVVVNRALGARGDEIQISLPRGYKIVVNPFGINLSMQVRSETVKIGSFKVNADLAVKYEANAQKLYKGGIYIAYFDKNTKKLQIIATENLNGKAQAKIVKSGEYVLLGKLTK